MVTSILEILSHGFKLWNTKEGRKYADQSLKLRESWYKEFNKGDDKRSQLALDRIEDKMENLKKIFLSIPTSAE